MAEATIDISLLAYSKCTVCHGVDVALKQEPDSPLTFSVKSGACRDAAFVLDIQPLAHLNSSVGHMTFRLPHTVYVLRSAVQASCADRIPAMLLQGPCS